MITLEKAKEYVEAEVDTFSELEVDKRGFLRARLLSPADLDISLIVHPIHEALVLRVRAQNLGQIDLNHTHEQAMRRVNAALVLGRLIIDTDGEVLFDVSHACLAEDAEDPGPAVFSRLLRASASTARDVARIVMSMRLQDARVPQDLVEKILNDTFGEGNDEGGEAEML